MEPFTLKTKNAQQGYPQVRLRRSYYRLVCRIKEETGQSLSCIIEQCIDYALQNGGDFEQELLELYTRPKVPAGCPLLAQTEREDTT